MKKNSNNSPACKFKVGSNIRKWRNLKDVKQKELANALQLSEAAVSNIENDLTNLTLWQLEDISSALDVPLEQLLSDPQEKYQAFKSYGHSLAHLEEQQLREKELVDAVIASLQKKDEQLQSLMQHFVTVLRELFTKEKTFVSSSKQVASRA